MLATVLCTYIYIAIALVDDTYYKYSMQLAMHRVRGILEGETDAPFSTLATTTKIKVMNLLTVIQSTTAFAICIIYNHCMVRDFSSFSVVYLA